MKDLLRISDLSRTDLDTLLQIGERVVEDPHQHADLLAGAAVITYSADPSTRTLPTFEAAIRHLGGVPELVGPDELPFGRDEAIEDTARAVSRQARAFVIRTSSDDDVRRFAAAATIPVINAMTAGHHPCQALADLLTLKQHFGTLQGLRLAYLGDGNNVAHSLLEACALAGIDITVATPPLYEPDPAVVEAAERLALASGAIAFTTHDPLLAVAGVDAVYTDAWFSMGDSDDVRATRSAALRPYQVNAAVMGDASPQAVFMHCRPAHHGDEVSASVIDGPSSIVLDEAENRTHMAQTLLIALTTGALTGNQALTAGAT